MLGVSFVLIGNRLDVFRNFLRMLCVSGFWDVVALFDFFRLIQRELDYEFFMRKLDNSLTYM